MTQSDEHQEALEVALSNVAYGDEYAATVQLARWYAYILDVNPADADLAKSVGPLYLNALTALGMTKNAGATKSGGGEDSAGRGRLDGLRQRAGARRAKAIHPAAS